MTAQAQLGALAVVVQFAMRAERQRDGLLFMTEGKASQHRDPEPLAQQAATLSRL